VCYSVVKYVFFSREIGCDSSSEPAALSFLDRRRRLAPVVAGLGLVGEHLVEGFGLLDEDVPLLVRLMQEYGL
jgi:hypothetical protein